MIPAQTVLVDTCVLLNLAFARRLEILGALTGIEFRVPEEALAEVLGARERRAVQEVLGAGFLHLTKLVEPEDLAVFADLRQLMGAGEAACLALAIRDQTLVASDEKRRFLREAEKRLGPGRILNTPGLFLLAIRQGGMTVDEADEAKAVLERHRFRMSFASFRELV